MRSIHDCYLYGILDLGYVKPGDAVSMLERMLAGGVDIVQLRAKNFDLETVESLLQQCLPLTKNAGVPLIVNDYPALISKSGCDGAHIGQDDGMVREAREASGCANALIGKSTHSLNQALAAAEESPDYIGFGPLFATPTKPDYVPIGMSEIQSVIAALPNLPVFCIGGIKMENLQAVLHAGANRVVIVSGILAADNVEQYCRSVKALLSKE